MISVLTIVPKSSVSTSSSATRIQAENVQLGVA
jgi:hypothetical protein